MTPSDVLKAAKSIDLIEEVGTWYPTDPERVYLTIASADPYGQQRDPRRLFLRLDKDDLDAVITALLTKHEKILAELGVAVEDEGVPIA